MDDTPVSPSRLSEEAYALGMKLAVLLAVCGVGLLYWTGALSSMPALVVLALLLPVYFICTAVVLTTWLGLAPDISDLEPVYFEKDQ